MRRKLQVFISSTYDDMLEERKNAVEAILQSNHIPTGMELFTSGDDSQIEIIKRWIDDADVFLLILGGRYGSIEKKTKKSFVQLEYEYAVEQKKQIFTIVLNDQEGFDKKKKLLGADALEQVYSDQYNEFRRLITEQKITRFYNTPEELKPHIILKLQEIEGLPGNHGWISYKELESVEELSVQYAMLTMLTNDIKKLISLSSSAAPEIFYTKLIEGKSIYDEKVKMYRMNPNLPNSLVWGSIEGDYGGEEREYYFVGEVSRLGISGIFQSKSKSDYEMGMFNLMSTKIERKIVYQGKTAFVSRINGSDFQKSPYIWAEEIVGVDFLSKLKPEFKRHFMKILKPIKRKPRKQ
jgi:hypothetical protein